MKNELETLKDLFGDKTENYTITEVLWAMNIFANQFKWIKTTCGKNIIFDDLDYEVLRQQNLFYANDRECVMAVWKSKNGKRTVAPVAKLLLEADGNAIIHYKDKNPLNLKRNNIELVNVQTAHFKQKKQKTANGIKPTSIYKGVSWSKFAKKWSAYIKLNYGKKHLGYYLIEEDAAKAYNKAAIENFGINYSNLNSIPTN
mgnify:FL=1